MVKFQHNNYCVISVYWDCYQWMFLHFVAWYLEGMFSVWIEIQEC